MPAGHAPHCPTGGGVMTVSAGFSVHPASARLIHRVTRATSLVIEPAPLACGPCNQPRKKLVPPARRRDTRPSQRCNANYGVTVIAAVPLFPSLVAVIVADPGPTPLTRPVWSTVATLGSLVDQVITRPPSALPFASRVVAVSCTVEFTGTVWPTTRSPRCSTFPQADR